MPSLQQYLTVLGGKDTDISDILKGGSFYATKVNPRLKDSPGPAVLFFKMIFNEVKNYDMAAILAVYEESNNIHKGQLSARITTTARDDIEKAEILSDYKDLVLLCKPIISYATQLLKSENISFAQYLGIVVNTMKIAYDPRNIDALSCLKNDAAILSFSTLGAYIAIVIGNILNAFGIKVGAEMIDNAHAKLNINSSLTEVGLFAPKAEKNPEAPLDAFSDFVPGFDG